MKKLFCLITLVFSLAAKGITVGIPEELYQSLRYEDNTLKGLMSEHYRCVLSASKLSPVYVTLPHARVVSSLQNGRIAIGLPLVHTQLRSRFALHADTLLSANFEIVVPEDSQLESLDMLPDEALRSTVAVKRGTAVKEIFLQSAGFPEDTEKVAFLDMNTWEGALAFVQRGRGDISIIPTVIKQSISPEILDGLKFFPSRGKAYLIVRKQKL